MTADQPNGAEQPTRMGAAVGLGIASVERRWANVVIGLLLTVTGFLLSTMLTFALFWLNSLSGRVAALETKAAVIEATMNEIRFDVKDIKGRLPK